MIDARNRRVIINFVTNGIFNMSVTKFDWVGDEDEGYGYY